MAIPSASLRFKHRSARVYKGYGPFREGFHDAAGTAHLVLATSVGPPSLTREVSPIQTTAQPEMEPVCGSPVHYGLHRRENEGVPGLVVKYLEPREGHSHRCTQDTVYLYTDSSSMGWGAHVAQHTASGTWKDPDKELN